MDIYQRTTDYLLTLPIFEAWAEMKTILQRAASLRPRDWQLPVLACQAIGDVDKAVPASAGLACAQISIILVDDMLDDDPRGEYRYTGHGRASNLALAFQSAGMDTLIKSGASSSAWLEALNSLNRMMLTTAHGQELDVQNSEDEDSYWRVVENKSAPFYGCAFHLGALFAEAREETAQNLEQLGRIYGEMIQIHDDLNDTMAVPANSDWLQKRKPLPILFALTVEHPDRARFMELYEDISVGGALREAQEILIRCGAVSYCVDQLIRRHQIAQEILNKTQLAHKEILDSLLGEVIAPVWKLFESLGLSPRALPTVTSAPSQE
ncbi:MAG TPA: polyprenyl synthetase family protein [Anaerolineales bacterium]|nr:polyprenyl synthetase family protein [Anaerolineales bacterium]